MGAEKVLDLYLRGESQEKAPEAKLFPETP